MHGRKHIYRVAALLTAVAALAFFAATCGLSPSPHRERRGAEGVGLENLFVRGRAHVRAAERSRREVRRIGPEKGRVEHVQAAAEREPQPAQPERRGVEAE
jgi:hypothetical protein